MTQKSLKLPGMQLVKFYSQFDQVLNFPEEGVSLGNVLSGLGVHAELHFIDVGVSDNSMYDVHSSVLSSTDKSRGMTDIPLIPFLLTFNFCRNSRFLASLERQYSLNISNVTPPIRSSPVKALNTIRT